MCIRDRIVEADSGAIGGKDSKEFILLSESGEDTIVLCGKCDYAANGEKSEFTKPSIPLENLDDQNEIHTPNVKTIEELCDFLAIASTKTLKSVFYKIDDEFVIAVIRGDLEINDSYNRTEITMGLSWHVADGAVFKADYQIMDDASDVERDNKFNLGFGVWF